MSAKLYAIPVPGLQNIPELLRNISDSIEDGTFGDVVEGVLVINGENLELFGLGTSDGAAAHLLLALGQRKLENACM